MGLDTVELVMAVEEEFGIEIPDAAATKITTVGALYDFVLSELRRVERPNVDSDETYAKLRDLICEQLGVEPAEVVPDANFVRDLGAS